MEMMTSRKAGFASAEHPIYSTPNASAKQYKAEKALCQNHDWMRDNIVCDKHVTARVEARRSDIIPEVVNRTVPHAGPDGPFEGPVDGKTTSRKNHLDRRLIPKVDAPRLLQDRTEIHRAKSQKWIISGMSNIVPDEGTLTPARHTYTTVSVSGARKGSVDAPWTRGTIGPILGVVSEDAAP
eukprot:Selendium_serpulae@DN3232_c0_g1_i3.p2